MSRVLKSDKLKTKKPETQTLRSDGAQNKKVLVQKTTVSRSLKASTTKLNAVVPVNDENEKNENKQSNGANNTSTHSNPKAGAVRVHKLQHRERTSSGGSVQSNKLVTRKVSSTSQQQPQQQKQVPLRAKQVTAATSKTNKTTTLKHKPSTTTTTTTAAATTKAIEKTAVHKKPNAVLNTPHNVTVCSPPPKRKSDKTIKSISKDDAKAHSSKLIRKGSRTLAPDEILILKRDPAKINIEAREQKESIQIESSNNVGVPLKEAVAFEVKFEDTDKTANKKNKKDSNSCDKNFDAIDVKNGNDDEELNYSDDFESYESDFETDSSTQSLAKSFESSSLQSNDGDNEIPVEKAEFQQDSSSFNQLISDEESDHEENSEITQCPVTEIQNNKERKLDSGHYDMNSRTINTTIKSSDMSGQFNQPLTNSLETFSAGTSEQMDSGISACANSSPIANNKNNNSNNFEIFYGGYKDFYAKPIINSRGSELMKKIQLDILTFKLLDLKPISYDLFMQSFGKLNTNQNFTQTDDNRTHVEQQTEDQETRSIWTQYPAEFQFDSAKNLDKNGIYNQQQCCGEIIDEHQSQRLTSCKLEQSLDAIKELHIQRSKRDFQNYQERQRRPVNYERLSSFLLRSSLQIELVLGSSRSNIESKPITDAIEQETDQILNRVCDNSFYIDTNFLNTLRVLKIFSNSKYNLLVTVHESLPDTNVYSSDFTNLLMVWSTNTCDKPMRLLTTWSQVSKVEISNDSSDIIVAALRDGSIALWDLRETYSFCSKLDGYLTHFAATQSIIPYWSGEKINSILDFGACLDVKSFKSKTNDILTQTTFPKTQFVSLHDSGFITIWTLVETSEMTIDVSQTMKSEQFKSSSNFNTHTTEYTSPWARVKLMQSTLANIKEYLKTNSHNSQSRFDKTKDFFQKNIYSDETLKELHEYTNSSEPAQEQAIRFASLDCGSENIFICTNRNFILMCSKTLKMDKLKRIIINECQFLFPTALKVLSNEQFVAVGLSNGVVMILNSHAHQIAQVQKKRKKSTYQVPAATNCDSSIMNSNDVITGKSCTIQNILLNAEKSYEEDMDFDREYRPNTAACISLIESKQKPFELRILDQQIIMSGSVLRQNLIQSLQLSTDGWYLFALADGHIRIFDFCLDQEILYEEEQKPGKVIDIATGKCGSRENNLIILRPNSQVKVHILNK